MNMANMTEENSQLQRFILLNKVNESKLVKIQPRNFDERNLDNELVKGSKVDKRILDMIP